MNAIKKQPSFEIGRLFNSAWTIFVEHLGLLLGATALFGVILAGGNLLTKGLASVVIWGPLTLGYTAIIVSLIRRQTTELPLLFSGFQRFLTAFMGGLLWSIFVAVGTLLCILPGLFVSLIYMLMFFYMFDKNLDFWPSMEASRKTIMDNMGQWLILWLVVVGLNLVGTICCLVGLLVTMPLSLLMVGLAYEQVEG